MKNNRITLAHGGGGNRSRELVDDLVLHHFGNPVLNRLDDAAILDWSSEGLAFTTDSYVVDPVFFPGGSIGTLAACGTINDLVMQGAVPKYLSMGMILEEGLPIADLDRILKDLAQVLSENDVLLVTGDTKVVERGKGSGIYINTAGIGIRPDGRDTSVSNAKEGDQVILTGTMGDHGIAVMSVRKGLNLKSDLESDVASLSGMMLGLLEQVPDVHCLRDPTRGGVAAGVCEIARESNVGILLRENALPVRKQVRGACSLLGFDPLVLANEGKALIVCPSARTQQALAFLQSHPQGENAAVIGEIVAEYPQTVVLETAVGGRRVVETPSGEDLPRIC